MAKLHEYLHTLPEPTEGRMFGYLLAADDAGVEHELWAFSGAAPPYVNQERFVGLPTDVRAHSPDFVAGEKRVMELTEAIENQRNQTKVHLIEQQIEVLRSKARDDLERLNAFHRAKKATRDRIRRQAQSKSQMLDRESQFDRARMRERKQHWKASEQMLLAQLDDAQRDVKLLTEERALLSAQLQRMWFERFLIPNGKRQWASIADVFEQANAGVPPSGTGECAAPKLLAACFKRGWKPIHFEEFWWGKPPAGELRKHLHPYPPCRGRCYPLLNFMLKGTRLSLPAEPADVRCLHALEYRFETGGYVIVNKPAGLLSVPGKTERDSVQERVKQRYQNASGPLMVHRLDQATSGLMVVALDHRHYKALQLQFTDRKVVKRYRALLSGVLEADEGRIDLPIRPDPVDRPRQVVDQKLGKPAITRWQKICVSGSGTWVWFWPETGRTHQLRVHAAHPQGLNAPIVGDALYGEPFDRLMLFAESIEFTDPLTLERVSFEYVDPLSEGD